MAIFGDNTNKYVIMRRKRRKGRKADEGKEERGTRGIGSEPATPEMTGTTLVLGAGRTSLRMDSRRKLAPAQHSTHGGQTREPTIAGGESRRNAERLPLPRHAGL